jgi:hypothetical protein
VTLDRNAIRDLTEDGLLINGARLAATPGGRLVLNAVIERLAP